MNTSNETLPTPTSEAERHLCPHCLQPNSPSAHFCSGCRVPIHPLAFNVPEEAARADGWMYGEMAMQRRPKFLVLVAAWLLLVPPVAILLPYAIAPAFREQGRFLLLSMFLWIPLSLWVVFRVTRSYLRARRRAAQAVEAAEPE